MNEMFNNENIKLMSNLIKNNQNKNSYKFLKTNTNQISTLKTLLPYFSNNDNNNNFLDKMINSLEINQFISDYQNSSKNIDTNQLSELKKETIFHIKSNLNQNTQYMADILLKFMEIKEIIKNEGEKNGI